MAKRGASKAKAKPTAKRVVAMPPRQVRARYDAAQYNDENRRHWAMADGLSADAAASPGVRRTLRNRSRYEAANNSYARGIVNTLAADAIGTGPRLQMIGLEREEAAFVEGEFAAWCAAADLPEKLRTARMARAVDGEAFGLLTTNPALPTRVQLDVRLVEAEQVASSDLFAGIDERNAVDGIRFDAYGNPVTYDVLERHPGAALSLGFGDPKRVPASQVLHLFVPERPGQRRGIPELTPALPLFAQLRRWTLSVLAAAETASDFAALMFTEQPPDGETPNADPFERLEIERRSMMTLPAGWKMAQLKAEQPVSTYGEFKREILGEIARCLSVPFNVAAGNSSSYNYASGRLDFQVYFKQLRVDRTRIAAQMLDRIFAAWVREAVLIEGYLPQTLRNVATDWSHAWMWDGTEHVDPQKEANAQATRLASMTTSLAEELSRGGKDWEEHLEQVARERAKMAELGLPLPGTPAPQPGDPQEDDGDEDAEEADEQDEEAAPAEPVAAAVRRRAKRKAKRAKGGDMLIARDAQGMLAEIDGMRVLRQPDGRIVGLVS